MGRPGDRTEQGAAPDARQALEAVEAAGLGVWDWDLLTGQVQWDDRTAELHGIEPGAFDGKLETFFERIHPDDLPRMQAAIEAAVEYGTYFEREFRVLRPDGSTGWLQGRGRAITDEHGVSVRMIGVGLDTTELTSARERVARTLEHVSDGLVVLDRAWRFVFVNPKGAELLQRQPDELVGRTVRDEFPRLADSELWDHGRAAVKSQEADTFEAWFGQDHGWFEVRMFPAPDALTVYFSDINDRRAAEERLNAFVSEQQRLLSRALQLQELAAALGEAVTVSQVARVIASECKRSLGARFGGVALLVDDGRRLRFLTFDDRFDLPMSVRSPLVDTVRNKRPAFFGTRAELSAAYPAVRDDVVIDSNAFADLPLVSGGQVIGAFTVAWPDERQFDPEERRFLATIAAQCAQAIERALLYERERNVAETLQRAILPDSLPGVDGLDLTARYLPAAPESNVDVGGDWYDAFQLEDGRVVLVIGDVTGHGLRAAAAMGRIRNALRVLAFEGYDPPAAIASLDRLLSATEDDLYATAVFAVLDPATGDLTWCNAGHCPLLLVDATSARFLDGAFNPLLGAGGGCASDYVVGHDCLGPEDALLLYTDGLIEHRSWTLTDALDRLAAVSVDAWQGDLDGFCDKVIDTVLEHRSRSDDLCMLAARRRSAEPGR